MKLTQLSLILIVFILISGCASKTVTKIEYIKQDHFDFQKVNLKGAYIELSNDEQICIPKLQELNLIYKETKTFYDNQIDDYLNITKSKENTSKSIDNQLK